MIELIVYSALQNKTVIVVTVKLFLKHYSSCYRYPLHRHNFYIGEDGRRYIRLVL